MHLSTSSFPRTILLLLLAMLVAGPATAQDTSTASSAAATHSSYGTEPPLSVRSAPAASLAVPAPAAAAPREVENSSAEAPPSTEVSASEAKASKSHKFFPYAVRPGDSLGSIAQYFGMQADDLARINK